ncbi:photolyase/cryptochrome [Klebsormidium nitens]|uniref:Photolyase/cryptochrome n=1 Tax=Klebsormidium nitens TaxID=105231 RepID=A0A1Y1IGL6_KLENI|nr:photolyase/cryptochrome [Klebsormidium nitens]|eukprot:GAQ87857.1 photolyase/cryptochrome [Klebsormidium nitens]
MASVQECRGALVGAGPLTVLVVGPAGAGKSSTVNAVFGRHFLAAKPAEASAGRFKLEECVQTINGSKVVVLEASGLSKAKDVEELRKSLSKKRKTVDLVLLVEALQQAGSVDVASEMGAKFGAQLLNAAVPVFACGHVQEEADEESKALYAKRSAAVLAAFGANGAEVPSRVIPLELEGASVCEEGLKVVLEEMRRVRAQKTPAFVPATTMDADLKDLSLVMDHNMSVASFNAAPAFLPKQAPVKVVRAPTKEAAPAPPAKLAEAAPKAPVQQSFPAPPPNVAGAASISIAVQSAASMLAPALQAAAATQVKKLRNLRGGVPMIAPRSPIDCPAIKVTKTLVPARDAAASKTTMLSSAASSFAPVAAAVLAPSKPAANNKLMGLSAFPDMQKLRGGDFAGPAGAAAARNVSIVWFRNDLRVHDNEALAMAQQASSSIVPVYCFDPRDYGKSSSGFDKTGPYRAKFLIECVADLRKNLRERGSELVVRIGKPEEVLADLARKTGAKTLFAHQEVTHEELQSERKVCAALKDAGVQAKFFWGSTLYHIDDLPFKLESMPSNYAGFREQVKDLKVRKTAAALKTLKGLPKLSSVEVGKVPTLQDLGLDASKSTRHETGAQALIGGESEALDRLKSFVADATAGAKKAADNLNGANFSCKISPWLAMGCLSPRRMYEDLAASGGARAITATAQKSPSEDANGLSWLTFELLWRDFFRFITKKYGTANKSASTAASPASAMAVAV